MGNEEDDDLRIEHMRGVDSDPTLSRIARLRSLSITPEGRRYVLVTLCPVLGAVLDEVLSHDARKRIGGKKRDTIWRMSVSSYQNKKEDDYLPLAWVTLMKMPG